ncbi:MAG: hypothetical protein HYS52_00665 [Candidatus Wildermuthbacteria bacterium]|nr:hypothetical protein [Candidatus Wildermuthbacteria bacterium]
MRTIGFAIGLIIVVGVIGYVFFIQKETDQTAPGQRLERETTEYVEFSQLNPLFRFAARVPEQFEIGSDLFITSFRASEFLTLETVTIYRREPTLVNGHDAVIYEIEKKADAPRFSGQPEWRNQRHTAIDVRLSKANPTIFYSFAFRPEIEQTVIDAFLDSLAFHNDRDSFKPPLERFGERIVKKRFGMYVTPQNSPVEPEFFIGYHTGVDYEIFPEEETKDVPVFAICGGELRSKRSATGYGGVAMQECLLKDMPITIVYGHLALSSVEKAAGAYLIPGETIGHLAPAGPEAGGGRKHLHLGMHRGTALDIRGYVQTEEELGNWLNPASLQLQYEKADLIRVNKPKPNGAVQSPLLVEGEARGFWFFEASFPIQLLDGNGKQIAIAVAQAQDEWK